MQIREMKMKNYSAFATIYDVMMDNIPYEEWEDYLLQLFYREGVKPDASVTELGCGTGTMTALLDQDGFRMTGLDLSEEMLRVARVKCPEVDFIQMDMRSLVLPEPQDVIISICDSMNYLENVDDLARVMKGVWDNLKYGGVFIFDLKTEFLFKYVIADRTYRDRGKGFSCVWKNHYDEESRTHTYDLAIKHRNPDGRRVVDREVHKQHVFTAAEIRQAAESAGFKNARAYGEMSFIKPKKNSERIYICLRK